MRAGVRLISSISSRSEFWSKLYVLSDARHTMYTAHELLVHFVQVRTGETAWVLSTPSCTCRYPLSLLLPVEWQIGAGEDERPRGVMTRHLFVHPPNPRRRGEYRFNTSSCCTRRAYWYKCITLGKFLATLYTSKEAILRWYVTSFVINDMSAVSGL